MGDKLILVPWVIYPGGELTRAEAGFVTLAAGDRGVAGEAHYFAFLGWHIDMSSSGVPGMV